MNKITVVIATIIIAITTQIAVAATAPAPPPKPKAPAIDDVVCNTYVCVLTFADGTKKTVKNPKAK